MSSILKGLMREGGKRTVKGVADEIASYIGDHPSDSAIVDAVEHEAELNDLDPSELFDAVYDHFRDHIDENLHKWFKEKWVRFGPDGKIRGACARGSSKEGKPKCLPQKKAQNLGKKGRKYAAAKKRREDPNPDRHGKAKNVATKKKSNEDISHLDEKWSAKYKSSINCSHPKGFSQKAHCAGKKKHNESIEMEMTCEDCGMCQTHGNHTRDTLDEACWKGYHKEGNKELFGKTVPNCVKNEGVAEGLDQDLPSVLYHATYKPRLKSIKLKGLGAGGKRNWEDSQRGVVYLALDPNVAESYAETSDMVPEEWLDQIVILKISTAGLDPNKFGIDSNVQDNSGDTVEYHGVIPVSNISLYKQGVAEEKCPHCGGELVSEEMINEKQDACYRKVKSRYKVWPSAYASGALVQCRKKGAANWGNKSESVEEAANAAQQAAIAINMKKHHKKPKHVDEDYTGIESGPSTGPFTAEKTPAINPYGGMKDRKYRGAIGEGISEGEVVPFRRKELTWKDIPGDVKSLLNDLFWAEMETGSYAGTTNKKYRKQLDDEIDEFISEMQNRGWRFHRDWDKNVIELTNTKGQTVTVPDTIEFFTDEFEDDLTEMPDTSGPVGVQPGGWRTYKIKPAGTHMKRESSILKGLIREEESLKSNNPVGIPEDEEMDEDTSYAGGMGQGGYAGQSYRKFKPKMAGTHMKRESSILKGLMREEELEEVSSTGQGGGSAGIGGGSMVGGPTTYEQEYNMFKRKGPRRITAMTTEMKNVPPKRSR